jgi:hypothetical protein
MSPKPICHANEKLLAEFARDIDLPSNRSPYFDKWDVARRKLSDMAWDLHSTNAYTHYRKENPNTNFPQFEQTGVYDQGRLSSEDTESLYRLFQECPVIQYSADDFLEGYSFDPTGSLEGYNTYRQMIPAFENKLSEVLQVIAPTIEEICGHHFRIVSSHIWSLNPGPHKYQWHFDWWPVALKKLFIFPGGVDQNRGSTAFRLKNGGEKIIEGPAGTWMIFENSCVEHKGYESLTEARPTIAISLAPSFQTDLRLCDAGTNSGYPWFPIEDPFAQSQEPNKFSPDDLKLRILKRIAELAGLDVSITAEGVVHIPKSSDITPTTEGNLATNPKGIGLTSTLKTRLAPWLRRKLGSIRRRLLNL